MFSLINRGRYAQAIESEFENLFARLRGLLGRQTFDPDGNLIVADPNLAVFAVGDIKPSFRPASQTQTGWLLCDGSQVSRVTYAALFAVIGTTHGAGDGSTTFNLPDGRGRFFLGVATSGTGSTLGATGGAIDHIHSVGAHTHSVSITTSSNGGFSTSTGSAGGHSHSVSASGDTSFEAGFDAQSGSGADRTASHTHTVDVTGSTDSVSDHNHSVSVSDHTHSVSGSTGSSSGGDSGAANPPFIAGHYYIFAGV
jgi:microcystin-dependent protein